jgi:hypothetical protein
MRTSIEALWPGVTLTTRLHKQNKSVKDARSQTGLECGAFLAPRRRFFMRCVWLSLARRAGAFTLPQSRRFVFICTKSTEEQTRST